jgi:hypothetical protein
MSEGITVTMPLDEFEKLKANQRAGNYDDDRDHEILKLNVKYLNSLVKEVANGETDPKGFVLFETDLGRAILNHIELFK